MSHIQPLTRPHFQPRQMVTADDLQAGVEYLAERLRRHNRYLHGCGVTCGMEVQAEPVFSPIQQFEELRVRVAPGQAISPQGDPIQVSAVFDQPFTSILISSASEFSRIHLGTLIAVVLASGGDVDIYVLLRHTTSGSRLRPTLPEICAPDEAPQANTRITDGYSIDLAIFRPQACATPAQSTCGDILDELLRSDRMESRAELVDLMRCPPNPEEKWLVLATVNIAGGAAGTPVFATHYRDRSLLPSTRLLMELLRCFPDAPRIDQADITRDPNSRWHRVVVTGKGFLPFDHVEIHDPSMSASPEEVTDTRLVFLYYLPPDLPEGKRAFSVVTQFDSIESADCDVFLDVRQPDFPPNYYLYGYGYGPGGGTIGGGNL